MNMLNKKYAGVLAAAVVCMAALPAEASLTDQGITYTLLETTTANPLVDQFSLNITGINGALDTEGGRYWLFRSGHYDSADAQWYLHGYFA